MKFTITKYNLNELSGLGVVLRMTGDKNLHLCYPEDPGRMPRFGEVMGHIFGLLDQEADFGVWLRGFPHCAIENNWSRDHVIPAESPGEKTSQCRECLYCDVCGGFPAGYLAKYGEEEAFPIPDLPAEVMIEVEPQCNFRCRFCYNHESFARQGRNIQRPDAEYVKRIIDHAAGLKIPVIRFTGGEPMLRDDIFDLMAYAKERIPEVRLNTNCSLVNDRNIHRFKDIVDNVLIPVESHDAALEAEITGYDQSLKQKVEAIKLLKKIGVQVIRVGTVATRSNIRNFNKLADFILSLPIHEWELYNPVPVSDEAKESFDEKAANTLVDLIMNTRPTTDVYVHIANAASFCLADDPNRMNAVCDGALFEDGHSRLVIDPRGFLKPHYFIDNNIGDPLDIPAAWNHPWMKKLRNLELLPEECRDCNFRFKCRGGRIAAGN